MSKVGRSLAPHLKALMPAWFLAQFDPVAPAAAAAAARSLSAAFDGREDKAAAAVAFCRGEIAAHAADVLTVQTKETLSDPK